MPSTRSTGPRPPGPPLTSNLRATCDLHVQEVGRGLPALYLVHGFGASGHSWRKWVPELSRRHGTKVVDLLGFGRSPAPRGADYSPEAQGERLADLVAADGAGVPGPILIGHSLGAGITLLAALALQDRREGAGSRGVPPPPLSGLVLLSPAVYPQKLPPYIRLLRIRGLGGLLRLAAPPRRAMAVGIRGIMAPGSRADAALADPEMVEGYLAPFRDRGHRESVIAAARRLDLESAERLAVRLGEITAPTLVIWGTADRIVPPELAARLAAELPNARGVELPGIGHLPTEEAPAESLDATLRFLASLGTPGIR